MNRIATGLFLLGMLPALAGAASCPSDRQATIKEGFYGAKTVRAYNAMRNMRHRGNAVGLERMIEGGTVIQLPVEGSACVISDSISSLRSRVRVDDRDGTWWVHQLALDR